MDEDQLTIVIATYNERETMPQLVEQLRQSISFARILIVDDNSPDGTGNWVRGHSKTDERLSLLHRDSKEGLGAATLAGLEHAMKEQPTWIATMDADLSHRVVDLNSMWQAARSNAGNVIIGSRYIRGGKIENWSLARRIASRCVNGFARWCL